MRVSVTQLLLTASLATALPQLQIPANNNNNIFRSFPSSSGPGIQGEVSRVTIVEVGVGVTNVCEVVRRTGVDCCCIRTTAATP